MYSIIDKLPKMLVGEELYKNSLALPDYDNDIRLQDAGTRLIVLSNIYNTYIPSEMYTEIYSKLYLALVRSLQKKSTTDTTRQLNENHKMIQKQAHNGIIGGSDCFTITGCSGIGKSSAIYRAIDLIGINGVIETKNPYRKISPFVVVQTPFDCSVKGLLLEILRQVDKCIDSDYYIKGMKARVTTDMLIGMVSQVALNHIGLLVVDEIQNIVRNKGGFSLVAMLTQLLNNSGISVCMVGTPETNIFFEQALQLARRSLGLHYNTLEFNDYFADFCKTVFQYQYTKEKVELTDSILHWLYEHSGGIISVVISLLHDAQEIAILNGTERICPETLNLAYQKRLSMLHTYIEPQITKRTQTNTSKKATDTYVETDKITSDNRVTIASLIEKSKSECVDTIGLLKQYFPITEVKL